MTPIRKGTAKRLGLRWPRRYATGGVVTREALLARAARMSGVPDVAEVLAASARKFEVALSATGVRLNALLAVARNRR